MDKKSAVVLTVIAVATLLVAMVGATFAYFSASGTGSATTPITVTTRTNTSSLVGSFDPIMINATPENFGKDDGDLTESTSGVVSVTVGEGEGTSEICYTASLEVKSNDMQYTDTVNRTPELIFTASKGASETSLTELVKDEDITMLGTLGNTNTTLRIPTAMGSTNYVHKLSTTTGTATDYWAASVTLVNLAEKQDETIGNKMFIGTFKIDVVDCE